MQIAQDTKAIRTQLEAVRWEYKASREQLELMRPALQTFAAIAPELQETLSLIVNCLWALAQLLNHLF